MNLTIKKISTTITTITLIGGVVFSALINSAKEEVNLQADFSSDTTIYLDKTVTIDGLGWWKTDNTYVHIWSGSDAYQLMDKINDDLFSYVIPSAIWSAFTNDGFGVEFYVYDMSSNQNRTEFVGGLWLKQQEHNYIRLTSANGGAKQTLVTENKEVEETKDGILSLTCSSTIVAVNAVVDQYENLRAKGKSDIQNTVIDSDDENKTYFERLDYLANIVGATPPTE